MVVLQRNLDWAGGLPHNIMDEIIDRLADVFDYIHFASVCVSWRSVALDDRNNPRMNFKNKKILHSQIPMLMLPCLSEEDNAELYSLNHNKILNYQLSIPKYTTTNFIGSSFGWLISLYDNHVYVKVTLFNPFTASKITIPPILFSDIKTKVHDFDNGDHIVKATLSNDPALYPDEYALLLIYGKTGKLACIKPGGDGHWHDLKLPNDGGLCDVIYSESSGLFFGLVTTGEVCSIDVTTGVVDCFTPALEVREEASYYDLRYIVETPNKDLLQVIRFFSTSSSPRTTFRTFSTQKIKVFKLDKINTPTTTTTSSAYCCWSELKEIGDIALFVGEGSSLCVPSSSFPGCRSGSVYYTLPYRKYFVVANSNYLGWVAGEIFDFEEYSHYDVGVADIKTELVESFIIDYPRDSHDMLDATLCRPPFWIVPTFQDRLKQPGEDIVPTIQDCQKRPRKDNVNKQSFDLLACLKAYKSAGR